MDDNIYSINKAFYHTDRIKALQDGKMIAPTMIQVDCTSFCNDNCSFCSYRAKDGYNLPMLKLIDGKPSTQNKPIGIMKPESGLPAEMAHKLPQMMVDAGIPAIELTGGGEPTLWPHYDSLIRNLVYNFIEIGLVTNGSNLSDGRLAVIAQFFTWIRFSMDASNADTHRKIHRTPVEDFDRRIETIRKLVRLRANASSKLTIGISFIVNPDNYHDIKDAVTFYRQLGVDNIRISYMYDKSGTAGLSFKQIEHLMTKLAIYKEEFQTEKFQVIYEAGRIETYSQPNDDFQKCFMQRFVWAIGADCKVYPCCIMKYHEKFALGDLRAEGLSELIRSPRVQKKMDELDPKNCFSCWLRNRNKTIAKAINPPLHHNFI